jgi:hypothetical protein
MQGNPLLRRGEWGILTQSHNGGWSMNRPIFLVTLLASMLALAVATPAPAEVDPASLAEQELAAESRGDVAAAVALYADDAIVQYGGLCAPTCVGKAAIQKELERRVGAKNRWTVVGRYVSGNVAVIKTELQIGYVEASGVDRVIVWCIYETKGDKIAAVTLAGQRTDPQTARLIEWFQSQAKPPAR